MSMTIASGRVVRASPPATRAASRAAARSADRRPSGPDTRGLDELDVFVDHPRAAQDRPGAGALHVDVLAGAPLVGDRHELELHDLTHHRPKIVPQIADVFRLEYRRADVGPRLGDRTLRERSPVVPVSTKSQHQIPAPGTILSRISQVAAMVACLPLTQHSQNAGLEISALMPRDASIGDLDAQYLSEADRRRTETNI